MNLPPRRITFQLVSLFDLLIIIIFAQYFDLQAKVREERSRESEAAREQALARVAAEERLQLEQRQFDHLAGLVGNLFQIDEPALEELLTTRTTDEQNRIRQALARIRDSRGIEGLRQILTFAELEKRCDLWQLHVEEDGICHIRSGDMETRLRTDSADRFAAELHKFYRTLPESKSLVMVLLSWDDASRRSWETAERGMDQTLSRLRLEEDRRIRFESAVLGYLPRLPLTPTAPAKR